MKSRTTRTSISLIAVPPVAKEIVLELIDTEDQLVEVDSATSSSSVADNKTLGILNRTKAVVRTSALVVAAAVISAVDLAKEVDFNNLVAIVVGIIKTTSSSARSLPSLLPLSGATRSKLWSLALSRN